MSEEIFGCEKINLDDYELKKVIKEDISADVILSIDKKTTKEVCIKFYKPTITKTSEEKARQNLIRSINISNSGVPFLDKTLGYRLQLSETEIQNLKFIFLQRPQFVTVTEYYKYPTLDLLTIEYLESNGEKPKIMNPTVRSKIIFGVSSIMKQLHDKNIGCVLSP